MLLVSEVLVGNMSTKKYRPKPIISPFMIIGRTSKPFKETSLCMLMKLKAAERLNAVLDGNYDEYAVPMLLCMHLLSYSLMDQVRDRLEPEAFKQAKTCCENNNEIFESIKQRELAGTLIPLQVKESFVFRETVEIFFELLEVCTHADYLIALNGIRQNVKASIIDFKELFLEE